MKNIFTLQYTLYYIMTPWRNGSASDSRSEGCMFESRQGQNLFSHNLTVTLLSKKYASNED